MISNVEMSRKDMCKAMATLTDAPNTEERFQMCSWGLRNNYGDIFYGRRDGRSRLLISK
jgi:hypothetical protein